MPIKFKPLFSITPKIAADLIRIEAAKQHILHLPMTPKVLANLRETARLFTTHYSTMIEGNRLDPKEIKKVLKDKTHFPGRERDEKEVKGYYAALRQVEEWASKKTVISESIIQTLHALIMNDGRVKVSPTLYRKEQNVIRDGRTRTIVYLPPEAKDVPDLMTGLVEWICDNKELPCPLIAAIAHYQFATIHPYFDGNGRTARLLTTLILHLGGYDLKGLYSLEEYYARKLDAYYQAISIGPSHNYYMGRAEANVTPWVEYFVEGMAVAFENVYKRMHEAQQLGELDQEPLMRKLDPQQRHILKLFNSSEIVTANQIGKIFGYQPRTSSQLCKKWVDNGFLEIVNPSNKTRSYRLASQFLMLLQSTR